MYNQSKILIMNTKYEQVTHMMHSLRINSNALVILCFDLVVHSCNLLNSFYVFDSIIGKFRNSIDNTEE